MKKHILSFALVATIIGSISMGCGSEKAAGGSGADSTKTRTDSSATTTTPTTTTPTDTTKKDTTTRDTSKKVPQ